MKIPEELKTKLAEAFSKSNELLRHFWSCFPLKSAEMAKKAKRIYHAIDKHYDVVESLRKQFGEAKIPLTQLVNPLDAAISFYQSSPSKF